ncbi:MAG: NAD(P)H-binding protein [Leptolyngbyaceae cyanobacterium SM1_1_3]|nr:NAD(P)H-binding protein [Leptolyngbyaceae cyanobacterium SM1_1_3]NJN03634.1 NAD(P)H-binding protein [Leptolyngbyaceae cyanobacterium RM1_1_2]
MSNLTPKILVYGANSAQGVPVVRRLLRERYQVRAFVRNRDKAKSLLPKNVEIATGTLEDQDSLKRANEGAIEFFLFYPLSIDLMWQQLKVATPLTLPSMQESNC